MVLVNLDLFMKSAIAPSQARTNQVDALLVLRAIACLMIVIYHCNSNSLLRSSFLYKGTDLSWLLIPNGLVAVWMFFCLSGYAMGKAFYSGRYSLSRTGVFNFWRNRFLRLAPLYYFSTIILTIFVYTEMMKVENWGHLLSVMTFTYPFKFSPLNPPFNGVVWSLSVEAQFYLVTPLLFSFFYRYCKSRRRILKTMGCVILSVFLIKWIVWMAFSQSIRADMSMAFTHWYTPLVTNLDVFLLGFLINPLLRLKSSHSRGSVLGESAMINNLRFWKLVSIGLLIGLYLFSSSHLYHAEQWGTWGVNQGPTHGILTTTTIFVLQPLTAGIVSFYIYVFEKDPNSQSELTEVLVRSTPLPLSWDAILQNPMRGFEILGHLSYGIYLWHTSILIRISPLLSQSQPLPDFLLRIKITLLLSIFLAAITYYTVELPASNFKFYPMKDPTQNVDF